MKQTYTNCEKVNVKISEYISRNVPIFHFFKIEGFKVGSDEASSQNCLVSISRPWQAETNQYIGMNWFSLIFMENHELRNEKASFMDFIDEQELIEQWQEWQSHK